MPPPRSQHYLDDQGRHTYEYWKCWHVTTGYRCFSTEDEAKQYAKEVSVSRIDRLVITIVHDSNPAGDPIVFQD